MRLRTIWEEFDEEEKTVMKKILKKDRQFTSEEQSIIDYFIKIRLIDEPILLNLRSPILAGYITGETVSKNSLRINEKDQIILDNVLVDSAFSRVEKRFLRCLLANRGKIVSREDCAKALWGTNFEKSYTDWALDQAVRRLRQKFIRLGLKADFLKTVKNRGYTTTFPT